MFINDSPIKKKIRQISLYIFNKLENNGNADFYSNGENRFIDNLINRFEKTDDRKKVIFDIGANIGNYTQMFLDKISNTNIVADFHLFEPTSSCFYILSDKYKNNENIFLNNVGISDESIEANIYYDREKSGFASLYRRNLDSYNIQMNHIERVKLVKLQDYIQEKGISHIDFIKIDIEGHELKALKGAGKYLNNEFIDFIQFEYGGANLDSHTSLMEIYGFLQSKGFLIAKVMNKGLVLREYMPYMDNFNYANYVAVSKKIAL
jgi:FkbM family methyltransferase